MAEPLGIFHDKLRVVKLKQYHTGDSERRGKLSKLKTYSILVDAFRCLFNDQMPDTGWITEH